jgi:site-specific DNA recombinase
MRAALYARVSTPGQAQQQTIEQQIERLQSHAAEQGWLLEADHLYRDDGYSGASLARPGLDSLRDRAALHDFDVVLITAPDRLARNYVHQMVVIEELAQRHIQVAFLERPMSDDPHDRLLLQIRGAVAEYERTLITERMRRGRLMKYKSEQLLPWTRPLYGYRVDPEQPRAVSGVQIDETQAVIVRQLFAWYLEPKMTLYAVAKRLTELSIASPTGKPRWNTSTVRNMLRNTAYIGSAYANRTRSVPAQRRRSALQPAGIGGTTSVPRPESDWIAVTVPALVDAAVFDQVQEKLSLNQQGASRNNKTHQYLLRGLVSCGRCHLSAHGRTQNSTYHYYVCRGHSNALQLAPADRCTSRYMPATQLDDLVWNDLCQVLTQPELVRHALERAQGGAWLPQELQARLQGIQAAMQQIERQQQRLLEAYLADVLELAEFERKRLELCQKATALHRQRQQLETQAQERLELSTVATSIAACCAAIQPVLDQADFTQQRQLVELLIDRVVVTDHQVEIRYVVPISSEDPQVPFSHLRSDYRVQLPRCQAILGSGGFHECLPASRHQCGQPRLLDGQPLTGHAQALSRA